MQKRFDKKNSSIIEENKYSNDSSLLMNELHLLPIYLNGAESFSDIKQSIEKCKNYTTVIDVNHDIQLYLYNDSTYFKLMSYRQKFGKKNLIFYKVFPDKRPFYIFNVDINEGWQHSFHIVSEYKLDKSKSIINYKYTIDRNSTKKILLRNGEILNDLPQSYCTTVYINCIKYQYYER